MNDKSGPWDVPLRTYVKEFKLILIVYNMSTETIEKEMEIDYGSAEDRRFLGKLTFWAATNGRSVETMSKDDWRKSK